MCLLIMQIAKQGGSRGRQNWLLCTLRHVDGEFLLVVLPMTDVDNERRFLDSTPLHLQQLCDTRASASRIRGDTRKDE